MPQYNQLVKLEFTYVSVKIRTMLSRSSLPLQMCYILHHEALGTATYLSNLQVVERNYNTLTRYERFYGESPRHTTRLVKLAM